MAGGLVSRFLLALSGRLPDTGIAKVDDQPRLGVSTETFRQILSASKAMKEYHDTDRTAGDHFHLNLGYVLAQRYREENRTDFEYHGLAQALRLYCSPIAARQFHAAASDLGKPMPFSIEADDRYLDLPGQKVIPMIDFYGIARDQAQTGGMTAESGPFVGVAGELWNAGMDGVPEGAPEVERMREEVRLLVAGNGRHKPLYLSQGT